MVVALAGCGGDDPSPAPSATAPRPSVATAGPPLCARARPAVAGRVAASAANELSGLALSREQADVLWTHNDSGDRARVFAVAPDGRLLAELAVTGAENVDWEDIATGPAPGGGEALYIADTGDNERRRAEVVVYRVAEPRLNGGGGPGTSAPATRLALRYPDGAHDAEALLVDPADGALVVVTKSFGADAGVYSADRPSADSPTVLRRSGRLTLGTGAVTGGSVAADGRTIVLRTYNRALVWTRPAGKPLASALQRRPCTVRANLLAEGQGEAIALTRDGHAFYTVPEGDRPAIRRYARARRVAAR